VTKTSRETLAAREGNKLMSEKSIVANGYAGMEFEVAVGHFDDVSISRAYAIGKRYYSLTAIVPKKNASSANVRTFLDSFQVTGRTGG